VSPIIAKYADPAPNFYLSESCLKNWSAIASAIAFKTAKAVLLQPQHYIITIFNCGQ